MISNFERKRVPEHWARDTETPRAHLNCSSSSHHKVTTGGRPVGLESRIDRYFRQRLGQIGWGIAVKTFEGEDAEFEFGSLANREPWSVECSGYLRKSDRIFVFL